MNEKTTQELNSEIQELRTRLAEAQETLDAIRSGEVDGLVISTPKGEQVYTISGAETPYRVLIEEMREGAVMLSDDYTVLYCNRSFAQMMQSSPEEIVGTKIEKYVTSTYTSLFKKTLSCAKKPLSSKTLEITLQTNNGDKIPVMMSINQPELKSTSSNNTFLIIIDLRERMAAEVEKYTRNLENMVEERTKRLRESERLAAIGQTAGMVGHDIRNPLQAIISELYLAKAELLEMPESDRKNSTLDSLKNIENDIGYINKIILDLQDFTRTITIVATKIDLQAVCEDVLIKSEIPENIVAICKIERGAKTITTDPDALKRVLGNLVSNAVQAMPEGGELTIRGYIEANSVAVSVRDTGVGIPEEIKDKLFTPLFTTKSKGQGFGLAVVKRITEALGGTISFESEVGKGTKFIVRLPTPKS